MSHMAEAIHVRSEHLYTDCVSYEVRKRHEAASLTAVSH